MERFGKWENVLQNKNDKENEEGQLQDFVERKMLT